MKESYIFVNPVKLIGYLNRKRLYLRHKRQIAFETTHINVDKIRNLKLRPRRIGSILLLNPHARYGDCLFVNALMKELSRRCSVDLVVFEPFCTLFVEGGGYANRVFCFGNVNDVCQIQQTQYDLVVDVGFCGNEAWVERKQILENVVSYSLTCDPLLKDKNIYSEYVDIDSQIHFGEKMAKILTTVFPDFQYEHLVPCCDIAQVPMRMNNRTVYFNTVGSAPSRDMSVSQIQHVIEWFQRHPDWTAWLYAKKETQERLQVISNNIRIANPASFVEACRIIRTCAAVISPDSAPVHVASAFNLPVLAFYRGRDKKLYANAIKEWLPMSRQYLIIEAKSALDPNFVPIRKITQHELDRGLAWLEAVLSIN